MAALVPTISSKLLLDLDDFLFDILLPVALPQILHEGDPAERRKLQDGRGDQNRNARPVLANQLFFKGRAGSEPQAFFVRQFVQSDVFRRRQIGPAQPAGLQILAAVADQVEKRVVGFRNAVELAGNNAGDGRFRRDRPDARAAAPQLFVSLVTIAEVAHHSGKALQISVLVFQRHGDDVGPESRPVLFHVPAFVADMAFAGGPLQFFLQLAASASSSG